ncbi:hypothetical protein POM88_050891 [Heracleum sosnowskyi]|uniref:Uncharacterized protein n=1 Tax=Heracleum sosnowskyi TaxID=360622 RepID=A0AAD8GYD9_9APIA|nr:hypothetical protein POM88_050891 [Heracleum sosnowskyi]
MGPPTVAQGIDQLDEKATAIEETMVDMVAKAVETAVNSLKQSLTEFLMEGQAAAARKIGEDLDEMAARLECRINRSREQQEQMINLMQSEQHKFCSEIRSSVTALQANNIQIGNKVENNTNQTGSTP